jgi:hypothetical protein
MKKLSAILSVLVMVGIFHQGVVLAEVAKEKKAAKANFSVKKKHAKAVVTPPPAPVVPPPAPVVSAPEPAASSPAAEVVPTA